MSSFTGNKRLLIPVVLSAVGLVIASVVIMWPSIASAQILINPPVSNNTKIIPTPVGNHTTQQQVAPRGSYNPPTVQPSPAQIKGSVSIRQAEKEFLNEKAKVSLSEALKIAQDHIANGTAFGGNLRVVNGYLVYATTVANVGNGTLYKLIVDAGNGSVLYTSPGKVAPSSEPMLDGLQGYWTHNYCHYHHYHHHHHRHYYHDY